MQENTLNQEESETLRVVDKYDHLTEELVGYLEAAYSIVFLKQKKLFGRTAAWKICCT